VAPPKYPAGEHVPEPNLTNESRAAFIAIIGRLPADLRGLVAGMSGPQLGTKYVNWTVGQIVSHLADSHMNAFIRFKLALTEDNPTIKPYKEWEWSQSADSHEDPEFSLRILEGLHTRWVRLLRALPADDFNRTYYHPEWNRTYTLGEALDQYAWHGRHHAAQIEWLKNHHKW
jgi:DinB superfamily